MVRVGLAAPQFDGCAVVDGRLVQLRWQQVHEDKTLVLLFDPIDGTSHSPDYLIAVSNAVARQSRPHAKMAVIWRNDVHETLAWANRVPSEGGPGALAFPLIADPDGRIAALYDLRAAGSTPFWGQFIIDPAGIIRQVAVSGFPVCPGVDELLRAIQAISSRDEA